MPGPVLRASLWITSLNSHHRIIHSFFLATFAARRSSQARDRTRVTVAATQTTAVTVSNPRTTVPPENSHVMHSFFFFFFFSGLFAISWAAPTAHGDPQARGLIGAIATSLRQGHSNVGSEPRLRPTAQLMATPDP